MILCYSHNGLQFLHKPHSSSTYSFYQSGEGYQKRKLAQIIYIEINRNSQSFCCSRILRIVVSGDQKILVLLKELRFTKLIYKISFLYIQNSTKKVCIIRKMKLIEIMYFLQGQRANWWQNWGLNPRLRRSSLKIQQGVCWSVALVPSQRISISSTSELVLIKW